MRVVVVGNDVQDEVPMAGQTYQGKPAGWLGRRAVAAATRPTSARPQACVPSSLSFHNHGDHMTGGGVIWPLGTKESPPG